MEGIEKLADRLGRLDRKAAAEALGVSVGTLANWSTDGVGPPSFKVGKKVYYRANDVAAFGRGEHRAAA